MEPLWEYFPNITEWGGAAFTIMSSLRGALTVKPAKGVLLPTANRPISLAISYPSGKNSILVKPHSNNPKPVKPIPKLEFAEAAFVFVAQRRVPINPA